MAVQYPSGWIANPNNPKEVSAIVGQIKAKNGLVRDLVAVTNWSTGATIYYESPRLPFFLDNPQLREKLLFEQSLFQTNASKTGPIIINSGAYNQYDPKIFSPYIRAVSQRTLEFNRKYGTQQEKDNLANSPFYRSLANTAQSSPTPDQQGGNPPASQNPPGGNPPAAGSGGNSSTPITEIKAKTDPSKVIFKSINPKRLQYPLDMKKDQDKIKFQACEFKKRDSPKGDKLEFKFSKPQYNPIELRVVLGIQSPISDQNSVEWSPGVAGPIEAALYQESFNIIKKGGTQKDIRDILQNVQGLGQQYKTQIQQALAGQAASLGNVLARTDNAALNPNLELLFNGPQLRPFTFQFKMSARNEDEAIEIKNIIKYFKYYMAVRETTDGLFLKAPYVFTIQYKKGESPQHPGLNLISPNSSTKACALVNCSVDYTPLGSYMTYNDAKDPDADGTMVSYTLSLQFQEIEPIYNTDYEDDTSDYKVNKHPIGY